MVWGISTELFEGCPRLRVSVAVFERNDDTMLSERAVGKTDGIEEPNTEDRMLLGIPVGVGS